ncbi:MAG TPA: intradiol ring-cleavage dioxygenase [Polyangiaceae bacterium]|jgi:protocatechuate 3,4-dioxygenase beta subunit|nr:intradiol ring-cleavage dioxygenase [Polyangiaceae bacterium]
MRDHDQSFDQGLLHDLQVLNALADRRRVLCWIASASAAAALPLLGCSSSTVSDDSASSGSGGSDSGAGAAGANGGASSANGGSASSDCTTIPEETGGPYPGDGSNGPNALTESGIVRSDITSSFGTLSGTAEGVPLTVKLKIMNANSCEALPGYAVYIWHCDRDGNYSMYTAADQNYLRGVQETAADGTVTFNSIYPACYSGRWPHIHFEIYRSVAEATAAGSKLVTSQLAMPDQQNQEVFAVSGYEQSIANYAMVSLATDMVFSDGATSETPTVTGDITNGFVASLTVGFAV